MQKNLQAVNSICSSMTPFLLIPIYHYGSISSDRQQGKVVLLEHMTAQVQEKTIVQAIYNIKNDY